MSIKGFSINGVTQRYDYTALDNKPNIPAGVVVDTALNSTSTNAVQNRAIASAIGDLSNLDTTAKSNLVAAINEAAQSGGSGGISDDLKQALLQLAQKVAYIDANGQDYYQDLYDALYPSAVLTSITAVYTQSGTVYTSDTLDSLKPDLTVTAHYDDNTSETVTNYTLSGNLTVGTSVITVSYGGKTDTFDVTVTRVAGTFSISNNLTGCSSSNSATTIAENASYNATITANTGYTLTGATVSITMGGTSVTGYYSNGTISIPNVTGDVVITVSAVAVTLSSISAVFNQGTATIYDNDSLDTLTQYLTVTATYSDSTTATVPSTDYTLSGTLAEGTSTITVSYDGKTATFDVTVTQHESDNLIDLSACSTSGSFPDGATVGSGFLATPFIAVDAGTTYYCNINRQIDSNGTQIYNQKLYYYVSETSYKTMWNISNNRNYPVGTMYQVSIPDDVNFVRFLFSSEIEGTVYFGKSGVI